MTDPGQIALVRFPQPDLSPGKLRPVLLLSTLPGPYGDWLVCMVSSRLHQEVRGFDDLIEEADADFSGSGLKVASVFRISRVAAIDGTALLGSIGAISPERLARIRMRLSGWIGGDALVER